MLKSFDFTEIGACLLNLDSGEIEDHFQSYVRPTSSPKLSPFCINLTGIRQDLIDRQETFPNVYLKLANWIERIQNEKNVRFASPSQRSADPSGINGTFCSWSDTDLKSYFKLECRRLNISALSCFKTWIDVRQSFNVSLRRVQRKDLITFCKRTNYKYLFAFLIICSKNTDLDDANFLKH